MSVLRLFAVGTVLHAKHLSRSPLELAIAVIMPVLQATLGVYLIRAGSQPEKLLTAAVGAGLMGVWSSVLFGSGGAVQEQRWQGTLEMLILAPRRAGLVFLPITMSTAAIGVYAMVATLLWCGLLYGVRLDFADPVGFLVATPVFIFSLGAFGLLLAATFVLLRNANALANILEYPVWLLSGMLVPITVLPGWTSPLTELLPTTWGTRAVQASIDGSGVWRPLIICLIVSIAYGAVGAMAMSYVEKRARASATLSLA